MTSLTMEKAVAIVELGGHQHLVNEGAFIVVNKINQKEGETFTSPNLLNAHVVSLKVKAHQKGPKISGLKFKAKTRYFKRYGHRQDQTVVEVLSIGAKTAEKTVATVKETVVKKTATKKAVTTKKPLAPKTKKGTNV